MYPKEIIIERLHHYNFDKNLKGIHRNLSRIRLITPSIFIWLFLKYFFVYYEFMKKYIMKMQHI